ncbi:MAG: hypothetical protein RLZZ584_3484 [Pseudomonadota bacterium]
MTPVRSTLGRLARVLLAALALHFSAGTHAADCDDPAGSAEIARCVGQDLRSADARINSLYKAVMDKLSEPDKATLRGAQRTWIRQRDADCRLDTRETNRELWYQALLRDYPQTICVTRATRQRIVELSEILHGRRSPAGRVLADAPAPPVRTHVTRASASHATGKWYFEFTINYPELVKVEPCVLTVGVTDLRLFSGVIDNVRPRDGSKPAVLLGFAVDLDNGKLYHSRNGVWQGGEPGSSGGQDLKLGRTYHADFMISADDAAPYLEREAILPNYGHMHMARAIPTGYLSWQSRP